MPLRFHNPQFKMAQPYEHDELLGFSEGGGAEYPCACFGDISFTCKPNHIFCFLYAEHAETADVTTVLVVDWVNRVWHEDDDSALCGPAGL